MIIQTKDSKSLYSLVLHERCFVSFTEREKCFSNLLLELLE